MDVFEKAIRYAVQAHAGTCRKGTYVPYILHPMEAATIAGTITEDKEVLAAAVLHDVVEDAGVTEKELVDNFGVRVAGLVMAVSENKRKEIPEEDTWQVRKEETLEGLKTASLEVQIICLADKLSNMRSIARDYKVLGDGLWERFNQKDKEKHKWYYGTICDLLNDLDNTVAWEEYNGLCRAVFGK